MSHNIQCWKCGCSLSALRLPFGREERCKGCGADLHVCKLCSQYDPRLPQQCKEPTVEEVRQKDRANFCDHYRPMEGAWNGAAKPDIDAARAALDKLFGK